MREMRKMRKMKKMKKREDTERGEGRIFCLSFSASPRPRVFSPPASCPLPPASACSQ
jgi:hypothetical protein